MHFRSLAEIIVSLEDHLWQVLTSNFVGMYFEPSPNEKQEYFWEPKWWDAEGTTGENNDAISKMQMI